MKATVIIPTFKRHRPLIDALKSLLEQDTRDYRIIVVDQSPQAEKGFLEFLEPNKDRISYIKSSTKGAAAARNIGYRETKDEIVIYCDDDIIADSHFIRAHIGSYTSPEVGGVAGRVITKDDVPVSDIKQVGIIRPWDAKMICNFNADFRAEVDHVWGCNMSFRRTLLERIGGFDERLVGTSSFDDADVAMAIRKLGYKIVFEPAALARHVYAQGGGCRDLTEREKVYWYYRNFMIFFLKRLNRLFFPIYLSRQIAGILRRAIKFRDAAVMRYGLKGLIKGFFDYARRT